jgi:hypothetical protein
MQNILRKSAIAAVTALGVAGLALGTAGSADARGGGWHHGGGWGGGFGPGFVGGLALGAAVGAPYYGYYGGPYAYDYGGPYAYADGGCYIGHRAFIDRWGHRIVRRVRVCD